MGPNSNEHSWKFSGWDFAGALIKHLLAARVWAAQKPKRTARNKLVQVLLCEICRRCRRRRSDRKPAAVGRGGARREERRERDEMRREEREREKEYQSLGGFCVFPVATLESPAAAVAREVMLILSFGRRDNSRSRAAAELKQPDHGQGSRASLSALWLDH